MSKFWAICKNTFVETIRQPIYGVLILTALVVLVLFGLATPHYSLGTDYEAEDQKMMLNMGLGTLMTAGLFISAFSAAGALSREIDDGTALTVMVKPLGRTTFVLGKFAGLAGALAVALYICSLVFLMTVRHHVVSSASTPVDWPVIVLGTAALVASVLIGALGNYWFSWPFFSAQVWSAVVCLSIAMGLIGFIGKGWTIVPFGYDVNLQGKVVAAFSPQLLPAMVLIFMAVIVLTAVAVAAGTRLGTVMTLVTTALVFVAGSIHPYLFERWAREYPLAYAGGLLVPNLSLFYMLDPMISGKLIPTVYVLLTCAYGLLYIFGVLAVGAALFQTRQLEPLTGSQSMPPLAGVLAWLGRLGAIAAGIVTLVLLSTPRCHTTQGFVGAGAAAVACAVGWIFWGCFGRGARWTYWLLQAVASLGLLAAVACLITPETFRLAEFGADRLLPALGALWLAAILTILFLPTTRCHFSS